MLTSSYKRDRVAFNRKAPHARPSCRLFLSTIPRSFVKTCIISPSRRSLAQRKSLMNDQKLHMPSQRRSFLKASGAFTLMVGLNGIGSIFPSSGLMRHSSLAELRFADFTGPRSWASSTASMWPTSCRVLSSWRPVKSRAHVGFRAASPRYECFSLAFSGPRGRGPYPRAPIPLPTPSWGISIFCRSHNGCRLRRARYCHHESYLGPESTPSNE